MIDSSKNVYDLQYDPGTDSYIIQGEQVNSKVNQESTVKKREELNRNSSLKVNSGTKKRIHKNNSRTTKGNIIDIYIF